MLSFEFCFIFYKSCCRFFGRPFVKRFALCYRSIVCPVLSVCNVPALWPNGCMDQDKTWHSGRPRLWSLWVGRGPTSPSPKGHSPHQFSAHICCGQMAAWIKMSLGMELGIDPGDFVLDGDPAPPPKKGGGSLQIFGPCLLWPNGWMNEAGT